MRKAKDFDFGNSCLEMCLLQLIFFFGFISHVGTSRHYLKNKVNFKKYNLHTNWRYILLIRRNFSFATT